MKPTLPALAVLLLAVPASADDFQIPAARSCEVYASTETKEHPVAYYLQSGWEIRGAASSSPLVLVLQKGQEAVRCTMRDKTVDIKGVPQLMTNSCAVIR